MDPFDITPPMTTGPSTTADNPDLPLPQSHSESTPHPQASSSVSQTANRRPGWALLYGQDSQTKRNFVIWMKPDEDGTVSLSQSEFFNIQHRMELLADTRVRIISSSSPSTTTTIAVDTEERMPSPSPRCWLSFPASQDNINNIPPLPPVPPYGRSLDHAVTRGGAGTFSAPVAQSQHPRIDNARSTYAGVIPRSSLLIQMQGQQLGAAATAGNPRRSAFDAPIRRAQSNRAEQRPPRQL